MQALLTNTVKKMFKWTKTYQIMTKISQKHLRYQLGLYINKSKVD